LVQPGIAPLDLGEPRVCGKPGGGRGSCTVFVRSRHIEPCGTRVGLSVRRQVGAQLVDIRKPLLNRGREKYDQSSSSRRAVAEETGTAEAHDEVFAVRVSNRTGHMVDDGELRWVDDGELRWVDDDGLRWVDDDGLRWVDDDGLRGSWRLGCGGATGQRGQKEQDGCEKTRRHTKFQAEPVTRRSGAVQSRHEPSKFMRNVPVQVSSSVKEARSEQGGGPP